MNIACTTRTTTTRKHDDNDMITAQCYELKIVFGVPDKIEFTDNRTRYYVYIKEKLKIKCERKFEINSNNMIIGFSSKNCF